MRWLAAVAVLGILAAPLAAQTKSAMYWKFSGLQQGYCVHFLVSPTDAPSVLPDDAQPIRLDAVPDAPPALLRLLKDQPEYASWMPGAVCVYRFARADAAGKALVAAPGESETIGIVTFAARVAVDQPPNGVPANFLFTGDKRIAKLSDQYDSDLNFRVVKAKFGKAAHSDDERHVITFGKTVLTWDGHAVSDSAPVAAPVERVLMVKVSNNRIGRVQWKLTATTTRSMVGALVVQGKDRFAKVLRASPIRFLGPIWEGGTAELTGVQ